MPKTDVTLSARTVTVGHALHAEMLAFTSRVLGEAFDEAPPLSA